MIVLHLALGVDVLLVWGVLAYFRNFLSWIDLPFAVAPAVVLVLTEHVLDRALPVIAGGNVITIPGRERPLADAEEQDLSLSPTVLFLGFIFWAWLHGGPDAFFAAPLTIFVVLILHTSFL